MTGWLSITGVALVLFASLYVGLTASTSAGGAPTGAQTTRTTGNPLITRPGADEFAPGVKDEQPAQEQSQQPAEGQPAEGQPAEGQPAGPPGSPAAPAGGGIQSSPSDLQVLNRLDCEKIRGTNYNSPEERTWFLANCVRR
jgi:hypothetical protein